MTSANTQTEHDLVKKDQSDVSNNNSNKWYKGMASPNKKGRPKGIKDRRVKINEALLDAGSKITDVIVEKALDGDIQAASLVLSRITPVLRAQSEKVSFSFDAKASLAAQVEDVIQGVADGNLSPDSGKQIIETISALGSIKYIDELEVRLAALEGE